MSSSAQPDARPSGTTALVLGGGGVTGIAWEIGVLHGLRAGGGTLARALDAPALAVDARSGALTVFDAHSGVGLDEAVAAGCAVPGVWPTVPIGDAEYMDGGMASLCHATLAAGHDRVVVLPARRSASAELGERLGRSVAVDHR